MSDLDCHIDNASTFADWITNRGGIAVWEKLDLSDPGTLSTPAQKEDGTPMTRPSWRTGTEPIRIVTDPTEVGVFDSKEVKRFRVGLRRGAQGFKIKLTDAASRRLKRELDKAGSESFYEFDYITQEAVIMVPGEKQTLKEWMDEMASEQK